MEDYGFERSALIEVLEYVGQILEQRHQQAEIYVFGGAALILRELRSVATRDIDAVSRDQAILEEIGDQLKRELNLVNNPFDSNGTGWISGDETDVNRTVMQFGALTVAIASEEALLYLKLNAGRPKDHSDIHRLLDRFTDRTAEEIIAGMREYLGEYPVPSVDYDDVARRIESHRRA